MLKYLVSDFFKNRYQNKIQRTNKSRTLFSHKKKYLKVFIKKISTEDQKLIDGVELKNKYLESVDIFKNIRLLDKFIENDIFNVLFDSRIDKNHN